MFFDAVLNQRWKMPPMRCRSVANGSKCKLDKPPREVITPFVIGQGEILLLWQVQKILRQSRPTPESTLARMSCEVVQAGSKGVKQPRVFYRLHRGFSCTRREEWFDEQSVWRRNALAHDCTNIACLAPRWPGHIYTIVDCQSRYLGDCLIVNEERR